MQRVTMRKCFSAVLAALFLICAARSLAAAQQLHGQELRMVDPPVRRYLEERIPPKHENPLPPDEEDLELLETMLRKGDPGEAERVAWILGDWKGRDNVSVLRVATGHDVADVRSQAATSLGQLHGVLRAPEKERAIDALVKLVEDRNQTVIVSAVRALGHLQAASAAPRIQPFVDSQDPTLALATVRALGRMRDPANFQHLRPALQSPSARLKAAAVEATGRLGEAKLADEIVEMLRADSPSVRVATIHAIEELQAHQHESDILRLLDDRQVFVRRESLKALISLGGERYQREYLKATRDNHASVRLIAARVIGRFKLERGITHLARLFSDENKFVRQAAVDSMVTIGTPEAQREAADELDSEVGHARACASETLGRLRSDEQIQTHAALIRDEHLPTRRWATWAMGEIGYTESAPDLFEVAFAEDQDTKAKAGAILSMGKLGHRQVLPKCRWLLPQKPTMSSPGKPTSVRRACARAMGLLKDEEGIGTLTGRINDWMNMMPEIDIIRRESAVALGRIGNRGPLSTLQNHMTAEEETYEMRIAAHWAIRQITGSAPELDLPPRGYPGTNYFVTRTEPKEKKEAGQDERKQNEDE
jgi:HEAT repeat protein